MQTPDPHAALRDRALHSVLEGPGTTDAAVRQAAAGGVGASAAIQSLVDKIERHAYRVTDADVAQVQGALGDDGAFEVVVSAALGASCRRLEAGLRALEGA